MVHKDQEIKRQARPKQVNTAVNLIYASVAVNVIFLILAAVANSQNDIEFGTALTILTCSGASLLLTIFISKKIADGRNWARSLMAFLVLLGVLAIICDYRSYVSQPLAAANVVIATLLQLGAVILLFRQPAKAWFNLTIQPQTPESDSGEPSGAPEVQRAAEGGPGDRSSEVEQDEFPAAAMVTVAGAVGAGLGLLNAVYWSVVTAPQSSAEREMIYLLIAAGMVLGGAFGAAGGLFLFSLARRNPDRSLVRWAIFGGFLGGLFTFSCCFLATAFSFPY